MKIWSERYDEERHYNPMGWKGEEPLPSAGSVRYWQVVPRPGHKVVFVQVCGFTFEFHGREQVEACREYYARKVLPSRRLPVYTQNLGGDHWETQRWFDRLPLYLREEPKRQKVVKVLEQALSQWETTVKAAA